MQVHIYKKVRKAPSSLYHLDQAVDLRLINTILTQLPTFLGDIRGKRIALTAGSRKIANAPAILKAAGEALKEAGANPFVIAAMGSHGGGTQDGQIEVLEELGITEETTDMQIVAWNSWTDYGYTETPFNDAAAQADGIVLFNRVKPHTSFHGDIESGLCKMLVIGLGGPIGAKAVHALELTAISPEIKRRAQLLAGELPLLAGIAVVEDENDMLMDMRLCAGHEIVTTDRELLHIAKDNMPHIPVAKADILVVKEIGKCFSGTGMDTNIISRLRIQGAAEPPERFSRIIALRLAEAAGGNGYGIGLADFTTAECEQAIDRRPMYLNALTSGFTMRAMLPIICTNDEEALLAAAKSLGMHISQANIVIIKNTLDLSTIAILYGKDAMPDNTHAPNNIPGYELAQVMPLAFVNGRISDNII